MLSVQLVFDNWFPFAGQNAPSPFVKETSEEVLRQIKHNQRVLISICVLGFGAIEMASRA